MKSYSYNDIVTAYRSVGIKPGDTINIKSDLRWLGFYADEDQQKSVLAHFKALAEIVDLKRGTIVVQTPSLSLCNTDKIFSIETTPSEHGVLSEHIRTNLSSIRSFHPFVSYTAIGKNSNYICNNVTRHAFGIDTPTDRLINLSAIEVSIGIEPRFSCASIHHSELNAHVPYRYTKEFIHKVDRDGVISAEPFYLYVWYRNCDLKQNHNINFFNFFSKEGNKIKKVQLGDGFIYSYSLKKFYESNMRLLKSNIYAWLDEEPKKKPYIK